VGEYLCSSEGNPGRLRGNQHTSHELDKIFLDIDRQSQKQYQLNHNKTTTSLLAYSQHIIVDLLPS
jgi:hypothetical protein